MRLLIFAFLSLAYAQSGSPLPTRSSHPTRTPTASSSVTISSRPSKTETASPSGSRSSRPSHSSTHTPRASNTTSFSARFTVSASSLPTTSLSPSYTTSISASVTSSNTASPTPTPSARCIEEWSRPLLSVFGTNTDFCAYNTVIHNQRTAAVAACFAIAFAYCLYCGNVASLTTVCCAAPYADTRHVGTPEEQVINCTTWSTCTCFLIPIYRLLKWMYIGVRYVVRTVRRRVRILTSLAPRAKEVASTTCAVCMAEFKDPADPENPDGYLWACGHRFHTKCADDWFKVRPVCPLCNRPVVVSV